MQYFVCATCTHATTVVDDIKAVLIATFSRRYCFVAPFIKDGFILLIYFKSRFR